MTIAEPGTLISEQEFRELALHEPNVWELHRGHLREKPAMSVEHGLLAFELAHSIRSQIDRDRFALRVDAGYVRRSATKYYIPDILVIPAQLERALLRQPGTLDAYSDPLPLIIEVWSPSTGASDIEDKIADYQARGDFEIWRLHPYRRTLTAWRRRPDGSYDMTVLDGGIVHPTMLPGVAIDLDALFALCDAGISDE